MANDAYWFRHDSNASRDIKLMQIKKIYDFWGVGVYWSVIEVLREQSGYRFASDVASIQMLSYLIRCDDEIKFRNWVKDCEKINLLKNEDGFVFSLSLIRRMKKWETSKENGEKGGRPNQQKVVTKNLDKPKSEILVKPEKENQDKPNANHKIREDKKRREKEEEKKFNNFLDSNNKPDDVTLREFFYEVVGERTFQDYTEQFIEYNDSLQWRGLSKNTWQDLVQMFVKKNPDISTEKRKYKRQEDLTEEEKTDPEKNPWFMNPGGNDDLHLNH